ncbi:hypothetical protein [Psychroflexus aestuariivivens]|uniref:hypothetical protein n=1 Tax=Psychroflexus aestuariivivens TaxID=1795040 RepID=UPI000FD6D4EC|nr:hypothetical protein [Psychroflexus aestuariivivens]
MKFVLAFCFLLTSLAFSQEKKVNEHMIVAKGCESLTDNIQLRDCLSKVVSQTLQSQMKSSFQNTLNPGLNKFIITFKITKDKKVELLKINTNNTNTEKYIAKYLSKIKIEKPGIIDDSPVDVTFSVPLKIRKKINGPVAVHEMSRLIFQYDKSNTSNLKPTLNHCGSTSGKVETVECMQTYLIDGTYNSINTNKIKSMMNDGLNTIKIRVSYNKNNEISKIDSASGNLKLDSIFEETLVNLLKKVQFESPSNGDESFSGDLVLVLNYLKT